MEAKQQEALHTLAGMFPAARLQGFTGGAQAQISPSLIIEARGYPGHGWRCEVRASGAVVGVGSDDALVSALLAAREAASSWLRVLAREISP